MADHKDLIADACKKPMCLIQCHVAMEDLANALEELTASKGGE